MQVLNKKSRGLGNRMVAVFIVVLMVAVTFGVITPTVNADITGPDEWGYIWIDSNAPAPTVTYNWVEIKTTGVDSGIVGDNNWGNVPMNFNFEFYGNTYTSIYISTNGYLDFGTDHWDSSNDNIPNTNNPNNYIAPFWDDLESGDRKSTRLNSSHIPLSRMPSSA